VKLRKKELFTELIREVIAKNMNITVNIYSDELSFGLRVPVDVACAAVTEKFLAAQGKVSKYEIVRRQG
jgi:hypothetical protein